MQFLLDQAAGHQPFTDDVGLVVLTGSRMSCEASAEHRALAAFLWGGPLIAEHARIRVIADEPDEELRRACAIIDTYALHPDGFHAVPYGQVADLSRRAGLLALAERLSATPLAQRCVRLDDVEIALSEQMKRDVPLGDWC